MPIVVTESAVDTRLGLILNPLADGFPAELDISDGAVYRPKGFACPPPNPSPAYASSYDTEGSVSSDEAHYDNREITVSLWVFGSSAGGLEDALNDLYRMVGQINREGGALEMTTPNDTVCYFDLEREGAATVTFDPLYTAKHFVEVECRFVARPFWRGAEVDLGTVSETSLPALVATFSGVDGDVPALGRLLVTDLSGNDQFQIDVGVQSRYYDSAATAALQYQAEDLTPIGSSTDTAGAAGASGTNVIRNTDLVPVWQAILKSEIDATNAALTHKGNFRLKARVYRPTGNTGAVSVMLEWGQGDYRIPQRNTTDIAAFAADELEGVFVWVDLGTVNIEPTSDRWEFRILAKSTVAGDEVDVDVIELFPTDEGYIELAARVVYEHPSTFVGRDEFNQSAGNLTGKTLPSGQTWTVLAGSDTSDFTVNATDDVIERTALGSSGGATRIVTAGTTAYAAITAQVDVTEATGTAAPGSNAGVAVRVVDINNYMAAYVSSFVSDEGAAVDIKAVAGGVDIIGTSVRFGRRAAEQFITVRVLVDTRGNWYVWGVDAGGIPVGVLLRGWRAELATGGALDDGMVGVYDNDGSNFAHTTQLDNFAFFTPTSDAAMFASQSLELRHDGVEREDSTGTFWAPVSNRGRGRFLKIPPSGPEGRSTRLIVKGYRNEPRLAPDPAIDDISAQLFVTPRGLVVPEA